MKPGIRFKLPPQGSRDGPVVIALASHQCGPGSIPGPDAISGLSLCWFFSLLQGFFSGFSGFPPLAKTSMQLIPAGCKLCSKVTQGLYSSYQGRLCMLLVWPCWAVSLLYFATAISSDNYYYYYCYTRRSITLRQSDWNQNYLPVFNYPAKMTL